MLEQQTLFMELKDLSDFTKPANEEILKEFNEKEKREPDEKDIFKTNFDILVDEFTAGLIESGCAIINRSSLIVNEKIFCIINYVEKPEQSDIVTPDKGSGVLNLNTG